ncbi:hypothetical protein J6TS2_27660 [Heyndrickxia sporothermodurans]|nr:hypothetical protein J6TS2_27660 [Heyndrickxia sporothermodurans]
MTNKRIHETQSTQEHHAEEEEVFSPTKDIQRIEGVVYKKKSLQFTSLPKGVRLIGYFMFGCMFILILVVIFINIIN